MPNNLKKRSYKAFQWDLLGRFAIQGVGLVTTAFLSRLLEPEDFGLLAMMGVAVIISNSLIDSGFGKGLIQKEEPTEEEYGAVFFLNLIIGFVCFAILFLSSGLIANFYERDILSPLTKVLSFSLLFSSFGNVARIRAHKGLNFKLITQSSIIGAILSGTVGVIAAFNGAGVWSLVIQHLLGNLFSTICLYTHIAWFPKITTKLSILRRFSGFSIKTFLVDFSDCLFTQIDIILIGKRISPAQLGYYYRANSFQRMIQNYIGASVANILFPALSAIQSREERFRKVAFSLFHIMSFLSLLLLGILYLTAEDLIVILFSDKWLPSIPYFRILAMAGFIHPLNALFINIILSKGNADAFLRIGIIKRFIQLIPLSLLFFLQDIESYLCGIVFFSYATFILYACAASKTIGVPAKRFFSEITKYGMIAAALIVLFMLLPFDSINHWLHLLIVIFLFSIAYIMLCYVFRLKGPTYLLSEIKEINRRN